MNAEHRRDQGADGLHGGLPDDDRQGHLHHQRHRAGRRVPARALPRASSSSPASASASATWPSTSSSPAPSTPTAASGSSSTSSRSRARTSPPAPASPASAASASSSCSAPSATTRSTPRLPRRASCASSTSSRASGRRTASSRPPRTRRWSRSTSGPVPGEPPSVESARAYFRNAFFENRRYDLSRVGRYKLNRKLGAELDRLAETFPMLKGTNADGVPFLDRPDRRPAGAEPLRGPRRLHLPAAPRQGHARATASTTRTTSPTAASARSAS